MGCKADAPEDLGGAASAAAKAAGLRDVSVDVKVSEDGKGPAKHIRTLRGSLNPAARVTAEGALRHPYFAEDPPPKAHLTLP